jgi:regulator of sigma E protease
VIDLNVSGNISGALGGIMSGVPQILLAVLVFGALVFVHEFGHFIVAKLSGIKVTEFALGMGPALLSRQRGDTLYALRLFPVGGFCAFEGDEDESADPRAFNKARRWKRALVLIAGSAMNLLLGLILLGMLSANTEMFGTTIISGFSEDAATSEWLRVEDNVQRINGRRVRTDNDMLYEFSRDRDGVMDIEVLRKNALGEEEVLLLKGVTFAMRDLGGIYAPIIDFGVYGVKPTVGRVVSNTFNLTGSVVKQVWGGFTDLLTRRYGVEQLSGPVGMTTEIGKAASYGWRNLFTLIAIITVNLGVFNLLPLPALDGGRLIFLGIEAVRRKPINPRYEGYVHAVGFFLLVGLIVIVTFGDISKLVGG